MLEVARYREDGMTYSFNALFISMRSRQQSRIPLRMAILNLVGSWLDEKITKCRSTN